MEPATHGNLTRASADLRYWCEQSGRRGLMEESFSVGLRRPARASASTSNPLKLAGESTRLSLEIMPSPTRSWVGRLVALLCMVVNGDSRYQRARGSGGPISIPGIASLSFCVIMTADWFAGVKQQWERDDAEGDPRSLLAGCDPVAFARRLGRIVSRCPQP